MGKNSIWFPLIVTLGFAAVAKTPIKKLYINLGFGEYSMLANVFTKATIILIVVYFVVRKFDLGTWGGFKKPIYKNHWMLVLPFIYPGILTYSNLSEDCFQGIILLSLIPSLILGLMEEIVFRGLIQGYLVKNMDRPAYHRVMILTSLLFALGHFLNATNHHIASVINQVVYAFFMGMLFSSIQLRVNNVWLLGIAHGLLNIFFTGCGTIQSTEEETIPGFWDYLANIGSLIIVFSPCLFIYWVLMKKQGNAANKTG